MIKTLLNKRKTITIKYSNLLIGEKSTHVTFSLANVLKKKILSEHLKGISNTEFILNHKFVLQIPNSVFQLNISNKEIILKRWFYDKIKETLFIDKITAKQLNVEPIPFRKIVKLYLSKNY